MGDVEQFYAFMADHAIRALVRAQDRSRSAPSPDWPSAHPTSCSEHLSCVLASKLS